MNYSKRTAIAMTVPMAVTDVFSYVAEYTGIAIGMGLLGVSPLVSVPSAFVVHLLVVYRRKYGTVERILLGISLVFIASYVGSLFLRGIVGGSPFYASSEPRFLYLAVADIGAVIMPFMLFFQASATAEKPARSVWASRLETLLGAIVSEVIMVVIVMVSAGLQFKGDFSDPGELSGALSSVAGANAPILFGIGLVCAAFLALVVVSLAGAWGITEALGWGRQKYFWIYLAESIPAVLVPLLFPDLVALALTLMVVFVFVLMGPGIIAGMIASRKDVMGANVSRGAWKGAYWLCLILILVFGVIGVAAQL